MPATFTAMQVMYPAYTVMTQTIPHPQSHTYRDQGRVPRVYRLLWLPICLLPTAEAAGAPPYPWRTFFRVATHPSGWCMRQACHPAVYTGSRLSAVVAPVGGMWQGGRHVQGHWVKACVVPPTAGHV